MSLGLSCTNLAIGYQFLKNLLRSAVNLSYLTVNTLNRMSGSLGC